MENKDSIKKNLSNQSNQANSSWNLQFLQRKRQALRQQHERRKKAEQIAQQQLKKSKRIIDQQKKNISNTSKHLNNILPDALIATPSQLKYNLNNPQNNLQSQTIQVENQMRKIGPEEILRDGRILRVIERTLSHDEYKVQCLYQDQLIELIATKEEIVSNNIIPLLDFYEKFLGLR